MDSFIIIALWGLGLFCHFSKKLYEEYKKGNHVSWFSYWSQNPAHVIFSISISLSGLLLFWGSPEMSKVTAWSIGFAGESFAGVLGDRKFKVKKL